MALTSTRRLLGGVLGVALMVCAVPLMAQTGGVEGTAVGAKGEKLAKYPIVIQRQDINESYKEKTDKHGHFIYIGLAPGPYRVILEDPSGHELFHIDKHVGIGDPTPFDFNLAQEQGAQQRIAQLQAAKQSAAIQQSYQQATALYNQGKYTDAAQAFAQLIPQVNNDKGDAILLSDEGASYAKAGQNDKAVTAFQQAIVKDPSNKQYHGQLAQVYAQTGNVQGAEDEFKKAGESVDAKALEQNAAAAKQNQAFKNLKQAFDSGQALEQQGQYAQAAQTFERAVPMAQGKGQEKNFTVILSHAGDSWDKAKQYDKAVADYQKVIAADPTNADYVNTLGSIYTHMGKTDLALQQFQKAAQMNPAGAGRYDFNIGVVELNAGKTDDAAAAFKKATQVDPNNADAYYYEAQALLGKASTSADGKVVPAPGTVEALESYLRIAPTGQFAPAVHQMLDTLTGKVSTTYRKH
ncbi:MAG: tetratricopeptide repeat protein [Terriglobia bacterium]